MPRSRLLSLLAAAAALGCATGGLPEDPVLKDYAPPQKVFERPSGLRIVVQQDRSAPIVTVVAYYGVGSTSDPKGVEGLAHLVEHLAFKSKPGGMTIWDHYKRLGARMNAFTEYDFTAYFATAHKEHLNTLLQIEAYRLLNTLEGVTAADLAIEREIVRNELRQRGETTVGNQLFDKLLAAAYPAGHPLSRPIGGTHESITNTRLEHAQAFVKEHYRPENCTIVVSGDVDLDEVGKLLGMWPKELLFGPDGPGGRAIPPRKRIIEKPLPPVPPMPATRAMVRGKVPLDQPTLLLAWTAPGGRRRNDMVLSFVASRLQLAFGEGIHLKEDDDIEGLGASSFSFADGSVLMVAAELKPGADPEKARARVLDAIVHAWTTELGRLLTESVRWYSATDLLLTTADPIGAAMALAGHVAATGRTSYYRDTLEDLAKVRSTDAMDVAAQWLRRDRVATVYFEPEAGEIPRLVGGGAGGGGGRQKHTLGESKQRQVAGLGPQEILKVARPPGLATLPRYRLANGLEVYAVKRGAAPVAQIRLGIRGGDAYAQPFGLGRFSRRFVTSKCRDHGTLDAVGGRMFDFVGATSSTTFVDVLSGNLANGVAVLSDRLACLEVDEESFLHKQRMLDRDKKQYERRAKQPDVVASRRLRAELYPNHPYGVASIDPRTYEPLTREDAVGFVRAHYRPDNAVAVVVGDVDPPEVKAAAERYLTRWTGGGGAAPSLPTAPFPQRRKVFLVDRPKATQASVQVACRLSAGGPEHLPAFDVLGTAISARAEALREEWGATYGVYGSASVRPGGMAELSIGGAIENQQAGQGVARLLDIVQEVASGKLPEHVFLLGRWNVASEFSYRLATPSSIASALLQAAEHGWSADVWDRYPERLAALEPRDFQALLSTCAGKEIVAIVGDAATLRPQLEAAGLTLEAN